MVFDIGNVLVDWQPARVYEALIPDPAARAALFERVDFHNMNLAGDRNGDLAAEVEAHIGIGRDGGEFLVKLRDRVDRDRTGQGDRDRLRPVLYLDAGGAFRGHPHDLPGGTT